MFASKKEWIVLPTEKAAERKRRELFAPVNESVWLGKSVFPLPHFLNALASPEKPLLKRKTQKHLVLYCLKNFGLRYFEKLRHLPSLANPFSAAIRKLKQYNFTPDSLEELLKETGSLKENDLLTTYKRYEELKTKLGVMDDEDQYLLDPANLQNLESILFENFSETTPALQTLIRKIQKTFPKLKIFSKMIDKVNSRQLKNVELLSFPSPYQETNWFLKHQAKTYPIGILTDGNNLYNESIWQKLKNNWLVKGSSPFLNWREKAEGRNALSKASELNFNEGTLNQWLEKLLVQIEKENPLREYLETFFFPEQVQSLGIFSKKEWIHWLQEILEEKPVIHASEALSGIQWLSLGDGDYPQLQTLWVPGLLEGQLPSTTLFAFFQDKKDRSRPEWQTICEAFPDPETQFERKKNEFLHQLSKAKDHCWLTFPRLSSTGQDLFASPFTWDFKIKEIVQSSPPPLFVSEQKLSIEKERLNDDLKTSEFHTRFEKSELNGKLKPQNEDYVFSPSQLERYAACPFKYFAERVWDIPSVKEFSPEVDPQDRGTLFHNCLEEFLTKEAELFRQARGEPKKEEELYAKLKEAVEKVFQGLAGELSYANPELYEHLERKTFAQATQVLKKELEESRELEAPLFPSHFEWTFGTTPQNSFNLSPPLAQPIWIGGRIDRIDLDKQQKRFLVLDYKTGKTEDFKDKLLHGLSLQLPIYILAVQKLLFPDYQTIGGFLISVRSGKRQHGLVDSAFNQTHYQLHKRSGALLATQDLEKMVQTTMEQIRSYVEKIRAGYFSAQPKDCKPYCDYKEICRYAHKPND